MRNTIFHEFDAGRAGSGKINLAAGDLTFMHQTTDPDSNILPISILHVYQSEEKKWKLNLNQSLEKDGEDFIYIDGMGQRHKFTEKFFTRNKEGEREYLEKNRGDIYISQDGRLWLDKKNTKEIFAELVTSEGLILQVKPDGFLGSKKIETRHEELVRVKDEIHQLGKAVKDLEFNMTQFNSHLDGDLDKLRELEKDIRDRSLSTELAQVNVSREINVIQENLVGHKEFLLNHVIGMADMSMPKVGVVDKGELTHTSWWEEDFNIQCRPGYNHINPIAQLARELALRSRLSNQTHQTFNSEIHSTNYSDNHSSSAARVDSTTITGNTRTVGRIDDIAGKPDFQSETSADMRFNFSTFQLDRSQRTSDPNRQSTTTKIGPRRIDMAQAYFQEKYEEILNRQTQLIRESELYIEAISQRRQSRIIGNRLETLRLQADLHNEHDLHIKLERKKLDKRYYQLREIGRLEIDKFTIRLAQAKWIEDQLTVQLPVNYIVADKILGFNEAGNLVTIFDNYDNQVAIIYERDRITRVIDSEGREITLEYVNGNLKWIKDFEDRKIYFRYYSNRLLKEIHYPNGEVTAFTYLNKLLKDILPPSKIGSKLEWRADRVSKISNLSKTSKIINGQRKKGTGLSEDVASLNYAAGHTTVTDTKTGQCITYYFDKDQELIHKHVQGRFEQYFITERETEENDIVISQRLVTAHDQNVIKQQHLNWVNNVAELRKQNAEELDWIIAELDPVRDGNGDLVRKILTKDSEEKLFYKDFPDGRHRKLVKHETDKGWTEYYYDKHGNVIRTASEPDGIVTEVKFNEKGSPIGKSSYHRASPQRQFIQKSEIAENGRILGEYDQTGLFKTKFNYQGGTNRISRVTDAQGNAVALGTDFLSNQLLGMTASADGDENSTTYGYTAGFLTKLESGNLVFEYEYDQWGRKSKVRLNDEDYVKYSYHTVKNRDLHDGQGVRDEVEMILATYASGEVYKTISDKYGRLVTVNFVAARKAKTDIQPGEQVILANFYEHPRGWLSKTVDYRTSEAITYVYDNDGRVTQQRTTGLFPDNPEVPAQVLEINQVFNQDDHLETLEYKIDQRNYEYKFKYDNEKLVQIETAIGELGIKTDTLGRLAGAEIGFVNDEFRYFQQAEHATSLINLHTQNGERTRYEYDPSGNIIRVRNGFNKVIQEYEYDALNRLVKDNETEISYDNNGNILFKGDTVYTYNSNEQLIKFGDETRFQYDDLGNPYLYRGHDLKWSNLRNLDSFNDIEFKYNAASLRTHKSQQLGGALYESYFHWANDRLVSETRLVTSNELKNESLLIHTKTTTLDYIYGVDGVIGFVKNGNQKFYFAKNIQGDVIKIFNTAGETVAQYKYDTWGNPEIVQSQNGIAELNPIRYRGYYWDDSIQMYYLKTRYYDPEVGRFINMDEITILDQTKGQLNGLNLYAYCGNNPVMNIDPDGRLFVSFLLFSIAIGAVVGGGVGGVRAYRQGANTLGVIGGALGGAVLGAGMGAVLALGGAAGLAFTGVAIQGFALPGWAALSISLGIGLGAGLASYSIETEMRNDRQWNWVDFAASGVSGIAQAGATFSLSFLAGQAGLFSPQLLGRATTRIYYNAIGIMGTRFVAFSAQHAIMLSGAKFATRTLLSTIPNTIVRWIVDFIVNRTRRLAG